MDEVYYGMASCNGLESFLPDESGMATTAKAGSWFGDAIFGEENHDAKKKEFNGMINMMCMAAQANMQRRSVVFRATVSPELAKEIKALYRRDPEAALILMKEEAKEIALARAPSAKKFWDDIPNPKLDPMN